jgi:hypothetical protein
MLLAMGPVGLCEQAEAEELHAKACPDKGRPLPEGCQHNQSCENNKKSR